MIHLLWATVRPDLFKDAHRTWVERSSSKSFTTSIVVDTEDAANLVLSHTKLLAATSFKPRRKGICKPLWALTRFLMQNRVWANSDTLIVVSDDFVPPYDWDRKVGGRGREGLDYCLLADDGYQKSDFSNMIHPAVTIPILNAGCVELLGGCIYRPEYNHMFSDCELYLSSKEMGVLEDGRVGVLAARFEHRHWVNGKRSKDRSDYEYESMWRADKAVWLKRKAMRLNERLLEPEPDLLDPKEPVQNRIWARA